MTRSLVVLLALGGTLLATGPEAQAACARTSHGAALVAQVRRHDDVRYANPTPEHGYDLIDRIATTSLRVCNRRTGHTTVLGGGRLATRRVRSDLVYARGREILTVSAAGRYVAWTERIGSGAAVDRATVVLRLATFPTGRVVRRRVVGTGRASLEYSVAVAVNRWRDLVWAVPDQGVAVARRTSAETAGLERRGQLAPDTAVRRRPHPGVGLGTCARPPGTAPARRLSPACGVRDREVDRTRARHTGPAPTRRGQ
jgi:hypothetical protein